VVDFPLSVRSHLTDVGACWFEFLPSMGFDVEICFHNTK
ncbi:MAG: hypothetical protein RIQ69_1743, partial [Pseudomonadota bacterium]